MRIRETRTVPSGGMGGPQTEDRVRIVAMTDLVDPAAVVVADDTPVHDWQPALAAPGLPGMVPASALAPEPPVTVPPPPATPAPPAEGPK